ncbi:MAG TPA: 3'-5' exonuclease, partial [Caulobacteraceae bacterium]
VTHNAAFDRPFLERFCDGFAAKPFGCSLSEIDWRGEGFEGAKLAYLASESGFFYEKHRALNDCHAGLELLSRSLPRSGVPPFAKLLERARQPVWRIRAVGAPFDFKDVLKSRGYKWQEERPGVPKAWWIEVLEEDHSAELRFLKEEIYRREVDIPALRLDARDRFSVRVDALG